MRTCYPPPLFQSRILAEFSGFQARVFLLIFTAILLPLHGCGGGEPETGNAPTIESKEPGTEIRPESAAARISQEVVRSCQDDENSDFCVPAYELIARWEANEITDEDFVQGIIDLRTPSELPVPASPSPSSEPAASASAARISQEVVRACSQVSFEKHIAYWPHFCVPAYELIARWDANEITDEDFVQDMIDFINLSEIPAPSFLPGTADDDPPVLLESPPSSAPPGISAPRVVPDGSLIILHFDKPLFRSAWIRNYRSLPPGAFTVIVDGEKRAVLDAVLWTEIWYDPRRWGRVRLRFYYQHYPLPAGQVRTVPFIRAGEDVTVSYDREKAGDMRLRGVNGAEVASFSGKPVVNESEYGVPEPVIEYSEVSLITSGENAPAVSADGQTITLKFSGELREDPSPWRYAFLVSYYLHDGIPIVFPIQEVSITGDTVELSLEDAITIDKSVFISYKHGLANDPVGFEDKAGLPIEGFSKVSIVNRSQVTR